MGRFIQCVLSKSFQSTPSPRRETYLPRIFIRRSSHFNPLPPQGGRRDDLVKAFCGKIISIHSLPKEGDLAIPRDGSTGSNFNPLPPQGGRLELSIELCRPLQFQSTPSPRRETYVGDQGQKSKGDFNPLPPQGGRQPSLCIAAYRHRHFNPLPPQGGRQGKQPDIISAQDFNPLPPQGGRLALFEL